MVEIKWFGHACFGIKTENKIMIVTDPFDKKDVGYENPDVTADIVLVSHNHPDHCKVENIGGNPTVIKDSGQNTQLDITFRGISSFHDAASGSQRGKNIIFCFSSDGINICHLGDLGHLLDAKQISEIGDVDILFIPVGGFFTIDHKQADSVINQLNPNIVIPMHYKTPVLPFPIKPVDKFLENKEYVEKVSGAIIQISKTDISEKQRIVVLDYK